jgi:hypothetical protein
MIDFIFSNETRRNPFPWYEQVRPVAPVFRLNATRRALASG